MDLQPRHIRAGRALVDATQQDLASAAKLSLATLNNIEREAAHPRPKTMQNIRQALTDGGVHIAVNGHTEMLTMKRFDDLKPEDETQMRNTLLRLVARKSLLRVQRVLVFSIKADHHRCGILLDGALRQVIFSRPGIDVRGRVGLAELAAFVIGAFKEVGNNLGFLIQPIEEQQLYLEGSVTIIENETQQDFGTFLDQQFPEAQAVIAAAKTSNQHPLSHVLRILQKH